MSGTMPFNALVEFLREAGKHSIQVFDQFMPTLTVERGGKIELVGMAAGHPYDTLVDYAPTLIQGAPIDRLSISVDSYTWKGKPEDYLPGPLQALFEAGDPNVTEALTISIVTPDGVTALLLPYVRCNDGITWQESVEAPTHVDGRMADAMAQIIRMSRL